MRPRSDSQGVASPELLPVLLALFEPGRFMTLYPYGDPSMVLHCLLHRPLALTPWLPVARFTSTEATMWSLPE